MNEQNQEAVFCVLSSIETPRLKNSLLYWTDCTSVPHGLCFIHNKWNLASTLIIVYNKVQHTVNSLSQAHFWARTSFWLAGLPHWTLLLQCQDLMSQTSSPLSHSDSYTRSMDPLLPVGDSGRRRGPDSEYDVAIRQRPNDRPQPQVSQTPQILVSTQNDAYFDQFVLKVYFFAKGEIWGTSTGTSLDLTTPEFGGTVHTRPELAPSAREAHFWIMRLWGQRNNIYIIKQPV